MGKLKTHPGIKTAIIHLLNNKWNEEDQEKDTSGDQMYISSAATDQIILGNQALEKGYISTKWQKAQEIWSLSNKEDKWCSQTWSRKLIILLQTYTYDMWKVRNMFLHSTNRKEQRIL